MAEMLPKAIAAVLLASLIVSLSIAPGVRAEGMLSNFFNAIKQWFESSPIGNIFNAPVKRAETIKLSFYPETFEFAAQEPINISSEGMEISNFKGAVAVDMPNKMLTLKEASTSLMVQKKIGEITLREIRIASLELSGMKLVLAYGNWNETTENGTIKIADFLGTGTIKDGMVEIEGNASRIIKG